MNKQTKIIKEMHEPLDSFKTFKFLDKTSQGIEIVEFFKDKDDNRLHVIAKDTRRSEYPFIVGIGYTPDEGYWNQGRYDFSSIREAEKSLKKDYNVIKINKDSLHSKKKEITESLNVTKLADWFKQSVQDAIDTDNDLVYSYDLDENYAVVIKWEEGFGKELRDDVIQSKESPDYGLCRAIVVRDSSYFMDDWNMPYEKDGDVFDTNISISPNYDANAEVKEIIEDYNSIVNNYELVSDNGEVREINKTEELHKHPHDKVIKEYYEHMSEEKVKSILDAFVDTSCEVNGVRETISWLLQSGVTEEELYDMGFESIDIKAVVEKGIQKNSNKKAKKISASSMHEKLESLDKPKPGHGNDKVNKMYVKVHQRVNDFNDLTVVESEDAKKFVSDLKELSKEVNKLSSVTSRDKGLSTLKKLKSFIKTWLTSTIKDYNLEENTIKNLKEVKEDMDKEKNIRLNKNKPSKNLKESLNTSPYRDAIAKYFDYSGDFDFLEIVANVLDRIDDMSNDEDIWQSIDDELIYTADQWKVLQHYCDVKDAKWDEAFESFSNDIYSLCQEILKENIKESKSLKEAPVYDLETRYDSRKSFYGKAKVDEREDGSKVLYSYGTPVVGIKDGKATLLNRGYYGWSSSSTTLRHVKDFLQQEGFKSGSIKDLAKLYPIMQYDDWRKNPIPESCNEVIKNESSKLDEGVKIISDLSDYQPWSGAVDLWNEIVDNHLVDELDFMLEDIYPEGLTTVELNDLLRFEGDFVREQLGLSSELETGEEDEE